MITKNYLKPNIRFKGLSLFVLNNTFFFKLLLFFVGVNKIVTKLKYPTVRMTLLANIILQDDPLQQDYNMRITKNQVKELIHRLSREDGGFGGENFFNRLIKLFHTNRVTQRYFFQFLQSILINEVKRFSNNNSISALTLDITASCNRNCEHCITNSNTQQIPLVDYQSLKKALISAREDYGCRFFVIVGGEPLLAESRLLELISDFKYVPIQVFTNGALLNESIISKLENFKNVAVLVSLEGDQEITDSIRGKGSFEIAEKAFKLLRNSNVLYGASITVNKLNCREIVKDEFLQLLINLGCYYIWLFDYKAVGRGESGLQLDDAMRYDFDTKISEINKRNLPFVFINSEDRLGAADECSAGKGNILHFSADGFITPCAGIRYYNSDNNIGIKNLSEIIESKSMSEFRNLGCKRGCVTKYEPEVFKDWVQKNNLQLLYHRNSLPE